MEGGKTHVVVEPAAVLKPKLLCASCCEKLAGVDDPEGLVEKDP